MKELVKIVGKNIRRIRQERDMSLDQFAKLTDVSKSMLHQIERGESNPTVVTLWKIASSLQIPFSSLVDRPAASVSIIARKQTTPLSDDTKQYRMYPYFPFDPAKHFEILTIVLSPGGTKHSEAHQPGVEEYILVTRGEVEITLGNETFLLAEGDAVHFTATCTHIFANRGKNGAELVVIDYYNT